MNYLQAYLLSTTTCVKGYSHAVLINSEVNRCFRFENSFLDSIRFSYGVRNKPISDDESFNKFMIESSFCFNADNTNYFGSAEPSLAHEFLESGDVIIQINENHKIFDYLKVFLMQSVSYGFDVVQLQIFDEASLQKVTELISKFRDRTTSFELFISGISQESAWLEVFNTFFGISQLAFFSADKNHFEKLPYNRMLLKTTSKMANIQCGKILPKNFVPTFEFMNFSRIQNSCLSHKISIDAQGNIKNCPSMAQSFGNIKDTTLQEALDHPDFKKYWNVTKDQVQVCKDCEFRYICTDCRAYLENPEDMYSKPLKCGYDPYTGVWEEWSTNPLKQRAIDYYDMRHILPELSASPPNSTHHADTNDATTAG
jgi:SPASM domain peptide maturase of grasp-with-spasm system